MGEVDPAFIQDLDHRPKLSITEDDVSEIGEACERWEVINHGVPAEKRSRVGDAARKFFARPLEEKNQVRRDEKKVLGYYDTEHTKNVRDWKEVFDVTAHDPTCVPASYYPEDREVTWWSNQWPEDPPELGLMELIALSLGLRGGRFRSFFDQQTTFMRLNHYPACPFHDLALDVGGRKDSGALTILAEDGVGGLEVKRKSDGEWIRVRPTPDAFIINIGNIIQVWSNEAYGKVEDRGMVISHLREARIPTFKIRTSPSLRRAPPHAVPLPDSSASSMAADAAAATEDLLSSVISDIKSYSGDDPILPWLW